MAFEVEGMINKRDGEDASGIQLLNLGKEATPTGEVISIATGQLGCPGATSMTQEPIKLRF